MAPHGFPICLTKVGTYLHKYSSIRFEFILISLIAPSHLHDLMRLKCQPGSKTQEVYLQPLQSSEHLPYILELNYLRENHSEVVKATKAAELALRLKVSEHDALKKLLEKQTSLNDGSQSHINRARAEKDKLLAADQHMGEMEVENSIQYVSPDSCGRCQEGWVLLNTSCYFFSNVLTNQPIKKNWPDSRQDCISRKADLVVIESWEEQVRPPWGLWVEFIVLSNHSRPAASGTSFYWRDGEPNREDENCAAFYPGRDATNTWYDGRCHGNMFYWMCEMKLNEQ
uniref:C-type lectin domain-containing protein n=1 Tax=Gadus morhua TaxID=8049 RepID=A0A8C5AAH3_GADMO